MNPNLYWTYAEPSTTDTLAAVYVTKSEQEIIEMFWLEWCNRMQAAGLNLSDYTFDDCILDWVTVNWAWPSDQNGNLVDVVRE